MKLLRTEITPLTNELLRIELREQQFLQSPYFPQPVFHAHPELELLLVLEGYGTRIIGQSVEKFEAGDMVFIGPNVPHVWLSDEAFYKEDTRLHSKVLVLYFNPDKFKELLECVKELSEIRDIIRDAARGIRITGSTRDKIADKLLQLTTATGFEKIDGLLNILHLMSVSTEIEYLISSQATEQEVHRSDRLVDVIKYIEENIASPITLKTVAGIACMTEQSFCRFFRNRTKKSFSQYLVDKRMVLGSELLLQTDLSVYEISERCGYRSSSHFCKVFKEQLRESPYQYRKAVAAKS